MLTSLRVRYQPRDGWCALALLLVLTVCLRTAWICDDAAITLRTVLNVTHGYGAGFNVNERVQAYTHPLWFLLITAGTLVFDNTYVVTFALSIGLSMGVVWFLARYFSPSRALTLLVFAIVVCSKAYVDFTVSGLENPLSHALLVLGVYLAQKPANHSRYGRYALTVLLSMYLSRPDLLVLVAPLIVANIVRQHRSIATSLQRVLWAALPSLLWTLASLVYYGFPFPNTAYAKLGTGIKLSERIVQGLYYCLDSLRADPLTLTVILVVGTWGLLSRRHRLLALGIFLYLGFVIQVGGDFMSGRFFTAPLIASLMILLQTKWSRRHALKGFALLVPFAWYGAKGTFLSGADYANTNVNEFGIADERGFYFQNFSLYALGTHGRFSQPKWEIGAPRHWTVCGGMGFAGINGGPNDHAIDLCGLADPLLARMPAHYRPTWRPGHFMRQLPTDYEKTIETGRNVLTDPVLARYYDRLRLVTRGELFTLARWREIVRLNLGLGEKPDWEKYRTQVFRPSSTDPSEKQLIEIPQGQEPSVSRTFARFLRPY